MLVNNIRHVARIQPIHCKQRLLPKKRAKLQSFTWMYEYAKWHTDYRANIRVAQKLLK